MFKLIKHFDKMSHLRILETVSETFKEPRFTGYIFFAVLPTIACFSHPHWTWKGMFIIFLFLNLFVFSIVRISLD